MEYRLVADGKLKVNRKGHVVRTNTGKPAGISYTSRGNRYAVTTWSVNGKQKREYVHRLVGAAFIPNQNDYPEINHIDGNPKNNDASNLEWCTRSQNMAHAYEAGLIDPMKDAKPCLVCEKITAFKPGNKHLVCHACKSKKKRDKAMANKIKKIREQTDWLLSENLSENQRMVIELMRAGNTLTGTANILGTSRQYVNKVFSELLNRQPKKGIEALATISELTQLTRLNPLTVRNRITGKTPWKLSEVIALSDHFGIDDFEQIKKLFAPTAPRPHLKEGARPDPGSPASE